MMFERQVGGNRRRNLVILALGGDLVRPPTHEFGAMPEAVRQRRDSMQTFAAGCLAEADRTEIFQPIAHLLSGFYYDGEGYIRSGVEVEHEPAWHLGPLRLAIPRMQFDSGNLRDGRQSLNAVDFPDKACGRRTQ
jgi:hypothetical protein